MATKPLPSSLATVFSSQAALGTASERTSDSLLASPSGEGGATNRVSLENEEIPNSKLKVHRLIVSSDAPAQGQAVPQGLQKLVPFLGGNGSSRVQESQDGQLCV